MTASVNMNTTCAALERRQAELLNLTVVIHVVHVEALPPKVVERDDAGVSEVLVIAGNLVSDVLAGSSLRRIQSA